MENLIIPATSRTLEVNLNYNNGLLVLKGSSFSENAATFFRPIHDWITQYAQKPKPYTSVYLTIEYAATSSVKSILEVLKKLEDIYTEGKSKVDVFWHYYEFDENMQEMGEDYQNTIRLPFQFIQIALQDDIQNTKTKR